LFLLFSANVAAESEMLPRARTFGEDAARFTPVIGPLLDDLLRLFSVAAMLISTSREKDPCWPCNSGEGSVWSGAMVVGLWTMKFPDTISMLGRFASKASLKEVEMHDILRD
jgi:hypothetical protein